MLPSAQQSGQPAMKQPPCPVETQRLTDVPIGRRATVTRIDGGRHMLQRLMSLGITTGSEIEVLHHRGGGVVVGLHGKRVALGAGVASHIHACPIDRDGA